MKRARCARHERAGCERVGCEHAGCERARCERAGCECPCGVSVCVTQEVRAGCELSRAVCQPPTRRVQACACKAGARVQGTCLHVTSTRAKHGWVQRGSGALCPQLGWQRHCRGPFGMQGWGHMQRLGQLWGARGGGEGAPPGSL